MHRRKWSKQEEVSWRSLCAWFRRGLLLSKPLAIRRCRMPRDEGGERLRGDCEDRGDCFKIRINHARPWSDAVEDLEHELSHAVAMDRTPAHRNPHGRSFWLAHAQVHRLRCRWEEQEC